MKFSTSNKTKLEIGYSRGWYREKYTLAKEKKKPNNLSLSGLRHFSFFQNIFLKAASHKLKKKDRIIF